MERCQVCVCDCRISGDEYHRNIHLSDLLGATNQYLDGFMDYCDVILAVILTSNAFILCNFILCNFILCNFGQS